MSQLLTTAAWIVGGALAYGVLATATGVLIGRVIATADRREQPPAADDDERWLDDQPAEIVRRRPQLIVLPGGAA